MIALARGAGSNTQRRPETRRTDYSGLADTPIERWGDSDVPKIKHLFRDVVAKAGLSPAQRQEAVLVFGGALEATQISRPKRQKLLHILEFPERPKKGQRDKVVLI